MHAVVTRHLDLTLVEPDGSAVPVAAELRYDPADPYAVRVTFRPSGGGPVSWVFGRDLLRDGLRAPVGVGDVAIWPSRAMRRRAAVRIRLTSPHGEALLEALADDLAGAVAAMDAAVPFGAEPEPDELDAEIARLLAS